MSKAMTAAQFLVHADEFLNGVEGQGGAYEYLAETESQYRSECAMFGDAGPGQALAVQRVKQEISKIEAQVARINRQRLDRELGRKLGLRA